MLLTLLACGDPEPFAATTCSHHWPADIAGAEWRYAAAADGEYGPEGWRTVRTSGSQEWESATAFMVEFSAELDYETVESYAISGREAWVCDEDGSWFLGREQSTEWVDGDEDGSDSYTLLLAEPVLIVPSEPAVGDAWEDEVDATVDLGATGSMEGPWQVASQITEDGLHGEHPTLRIERAETFQNQTETFGTWFGDGLGVTHDEGRWELLELVW